MTKSIVVLDCPWRLARIAQAHTAVLHKGLGGLATRGLLRVVQITLVCQAVVQARGHVMTAAKSLGISRAQH